LIYNAILNHQYAGEFGHAYEVLMRNDDFLVPPMALNVQLTFEIFPDILPSGING
jgi:hypothetical protein